MKKLKNANGKYNIAIFSNNIGLSAANYLQILIWAVSQIEIMSKTIFEKRVKM